MMKKMMIVLIALAFACSSLLLMTSCAKKYVKSEEIVAAPEEEKAVDEVKVAEAVEEIDYAKREAEKQAELLKLEEAQKLRKEIKVFESENVYFDFDKSELLPHSRTVLKKKADWLRANPQFSVRIAGHCDERGTSEYNLALGERRANAAWKFLNALGISGDRLSTVSYGEEIPADPGHNEAAWSKNRRDEFRVIK